MTSFTERTQELLGKATRGPWKTYAPDAWTDGISYIRPADEDGMEIAHHGDAGRSRVANEANAALIVHLVNSAPALVELVKAAVDCRAALLVAADRNSHAQNRALKGIIAALAKLEGGQ